MKKKLKKRILFIVPLPPPVHGSAMMCQYIKDSRLINDTFQCDFVNLSTSRRMDEIGKRSVKKIFRFIGSYFTVLGKLFAHHYDACYLAITCHGMGFLKDAPFVLLCKLFSCNVIIHQHNKGMAKDVNHFPYKWLLPIVYKHTKVILLSWKLYPDIKQIVQKEQIYICPNGIPDSDFKPSGSLNTVPHLLFLSNLIESKGVFDLLDACKILKGKGYKFICNFVGGESKDIDAKRFNSEIRLRNLNNKVFYLGKKFGIEKDKVLSDSDIFVFPTCDDCFPLVLLEAMQHSLPIVTTNIGGIEDIVTNNLNGLICKVHDPKDLSNKIAILLNDSQLLEKMGMEGHNIYNKHFTLRQFETNITNTLKNIIS